MEQAKQRDRAHPSFNRSLYKALRREGILLGDFLDQRLTALRQWKSEMVDSGLALDLLEYHTTPLGSAAQHSAEELRRAYGHLGTELPPLVQECRNQYLLTEPGQLGEEGSSATRLAHDTLAPLVRDRFDSSDRPAQRARRILKNRAAGWADGKEGGRWTKPTWARSSGQSRRCGPGRPTKSGSSKLARRHESDGS